MRELAYKRILTVQDISCLGQCSLTVALPILSACGHEACIIPSAVLSNHTAFESFTFRDLSAEIPAISKKWQELNVKFAALYTGYLGKAEQVPFIKELKENCLLPDAPLIVDPAMADHGRLYTGFDDAYVAAMKELCMSADIILPNLTEACFLADLPYREDFSHEEIIQLVVNLGKQFECKVILTGAIADPEKSGVAVLEGGEPRFYFHKKHSNTCHGTGDVYASVFTGALMQGKRLYDSACLAADFTADCIGFTKGDAEHWYGVKFEPLLGNLIEKLK